MFTYNHKFLLYYFVQFYTTFVSLIGFHITYILFALYCIWFWIL